MSRPRRPRPRSRPWNLPERDVTPEATYLSRRELLRRMGHGAAIGALGLLGCTADQGTLLPPAAADGPAASRYPAKRNPRYADAGRSLTPAAKAAASCNYYEFSVEKSLVVPLAAKYEFSPWTVEISGEVAKPQTLDIDALLKLMPLEERVYRFRCVEAWAMTVPWTGFPLSALLKRVEPRSSAKYVRLVTRHDPKGFPGVGALGYPWPYHEALTLAEAMNELTLIATGIYGKPMPGHHGAPLRLIVPWKYGFKSAKSLVKIELTSERPKTFWSSASPEYGFFANVNPKVPHPRWSQASERMLSTGRRVPTQLFNGYGDQVAGMYTELQKTERIWY